MDHPLKRLRKPWPARWLPVARRLMAGAMIAAGLALAPPADAQQAAGSTYGPVQRADTLWELALRFRGDAPVNAQQAMIAILRANPDAFVEGNINSLRTGVTLRVPTAADMAAISPGEASAEFARHEEAWRNRRQTGSAAPAPGPGTPPRPATPPAATPAEGGEDIAEELREARATVAEMRERLDERDEAIEELLVQLAAARRELQALQAAAPAPPPDDSAEAEGDAAGPDTAPRASWLPVSPLILGSSLIVLLVLIVVVTLLRQRGGAEEADPEDPFEEGEEGSYDETEDPDRYEDVEVRNPYHREGGREGLPSGGGEFPDAERRDPEERARPGAATAAAGTAATAVVVGGAAAGDGSAPGDEGGELREDDSDDLPIGMDLEGEEDWDPGPEEPTGIGSEPMEEAGRPSGFSRHIEVGELDELDLDPDPATGSFPDLPADPEEENDPETGARPGRRE